MATRRQRTPRVGDAPIAAGTDAAKRGRGSGLHLPHERDESAHATERRPNAVIAQAQRDIEGGLVDTDMRATPGLDAAQRERLLRPARHGTRVAPAFAPSRPGEHHMSRVADVMTDDVAVVEPQDTLRHAAELMMRMDVGALPVCDGRRLLGMLTDRDIVVRAVAAGLSPDDGCVSDAMTGDVLYCTADQDLAQVLQTMGSHQVRRLPVIDAASKMLLGIVSLGDVALEQPDKVGPTVGEISEKDTGAP
jgi:CBS domain-containing protein